MRGADASRVAGLIPFEAIGDETRPVSAWNVHSNVSPFVAKEVDSFLDGYARDLMLGQPNHIEIVGEKRTVSRSLLNNLVETGLYENRI